jgi:TRAP-type uncharacterized transport system fused permease subunit
VVQRLVTLIALCKMEGVKPVAKEDRPSLSRALKEGWSAILLPFFILLPIIISSKFKPLLESRFGVDGNKAFGGTTLMFAVGVCALYALYTDGSRSSNPKAP